MAGRVAARLAELGISVPTPAAPAANYVPFVRTGTLVHLAGNIPRNADGALLVGKLGAGMSIEDGQQAAKACMLSIIGQLNAATNGNLDAVKRIVKLNVFVNSAPDFGDQPKVANGASDFAVEVFGEAGRHARSAVGVAALPFGVAVEIDGVVELTE